MTYEFEKSPVLFDLSCIENIPKDIARLQMESQSLVKILGKEQKEPSEIEQQIARLESDEIVKSSFISKFTELSNFEDNCLFFSFEN